MLQTSPITRDMGWGTHTSFTANGDLFVSLIYTLNALNINLIGTSGIIVQMITGIANILALNSCNYMIMQYDIYSKLIEKCLTFSTFLIEILL